MFSQNMNENNKIAGNFQKLNKSDFMENLKLFDEVDCLLSDEYGYSYLMSYLKIIFVAMISCFILFLAKYNTNFTIQSFK